MTRIVVLMTGACEDDQLEPLLAAALRMRADSGCESVEVVHVHGIGPSRAPRLAGISKWWDCTHRGLGADPAATVLAAAAAQALRRIGRGAPDKALVLLPPDPLGVQLAAILSSELDGLSMGRCRAVGIDAGAVLAHKAAFGGRVIARLRSNTWPCFVALQAERAAASASASQSASADHPGDQCAIELDGVLPEGFSARALASTETRRPLAGARTIVAGGRGMGGVEGFELLDRLAHQLDAAVGGSLPTIDAGWLPVTHQIGQSGKFVAPRSYLAVGISGTPQHLAGVSEETSVIALNADSEAPIFQVADVGVVGDWRELLPLVLERLRARGGRGD